MALLTKHPSKKKGLSRYTALAVKKYIHQPDTKLKKDEGGGGNKHIVATKP